jgi:hypothetical protein
MSWCKKLQRRKPTKDQSKTIIAWIKKQPWHDLLFVQPEFCIIKILQKIDAIAYDGEVFQNIFKAFSKVVTTTDIKDGDIGAFIAYSLGKKKKDDILVIAINKNTFLNLFKSNDRKGYHAGGKLCKTKLECLVNILCHESIHLIIDLCDVFHKKKLIKNYWKQTTDTHSLIPGLEHNIDLPQLKKKLKPGKCVTFIHDEKPELPQYLDGIVKEIHPDRVIIERNDGLYEVFFGKFRLKNV